MPSCFSSNFSQRMTKEVSDMKIKAIVCLVLCVSLCFLTTTSCSQKEKEPPAQAKSYYDFFDTVSVVISYKGDSAKEFEANCEAVSKLLRDYHRLFDIYHEYEGINNLMTVNKNAGKEPVKVDGRLVDFLLYCKEIFTLTEGKTNVAMGSVLKLWHDEREKGIENPEKAKIPTADALKEANNHTDINSIVIDKEAGTVYISDSHLRIDVGAIGKGYATEKAAELLIESGVTSYVLNIGGNIRAIGEKANGDGWVTGITNPDKESAEPFVCRVNIKDTSLVTSGDYERFYVADGVRYHHIIDPDTLMPAECFSSVSVFVRDSALADALSTALFCMSYDDGLKLVSKVGANAIWVTKDGKLLSTDGISFIS